MKRKAMPSLEVVMNPPRVVKGDEKDRLDREFEEMKAWATSIPVRPLKKQGGNIMPGQKRRTEG